MIVKFPKKPSEGKTNKYRLKGKGGNLQIQVFNKGGSKPFELNMYKEEFDLSEQTIGGGRYKKPSCKELVKNLSSLHLRLFDIKGGWGKLYVEICKQMPSGMRVARQRKQKILLLIELITNQKRISERKFRT